MSRVDFPDVLSVVLKETHSEPLHTLREKRRN